MQLYVRIRGRVHGPFEEPKLLEMVQKGQVSRVHQVSTDGKDWKKASEFPELFDNARTTIVAPLTTRGSQVSSGAGATSASPGSSQIEHGTATSSTAAEWYYSDGSASLGPISFQDLRRLCDSGSLTRESLVWKADLPSWKPAGQISGLFGYSSPVSTSRNSDEAPASVVAPMISSSGWVMFLAIASFLTALSSFGLFVFFLSGSRSVIANMTNTGPERLLVAFFHLINSGVYGFAGSLLFKYSRQTSRLQYVRNWGLIADATKTLSAFWMFVGIVLIFYVLFISLIIYMIFAVAGSAT